MPNADDRTPEFSNYALTLFEAEWRDLYFFLESHGYRLRPRYHPDWEPSWKRKNIEFYEAEDYIQFPVRIGVMDATRISDGKLVYLKEVKSTSSELKILSYLSSDELRKDPRNHTIPLLETLQHPTNPALVFMVMPFLRFIDQPPFETVEDAYDCGEQVLEGLVFMHEHHIAHRDCAYKNVMMDATALYPRGFHPVQTRSLPDISDYAPVLPRSSAPIKYYFLDFGISTQFDQGDQSRLVIGRDGLERSVPELSDDVPYDPFKVDICILGALFKQHMLDKYSNLDAIAALVARMTSKDPQSRPNATEALEEWREIRRQTPPRQRFWRIKPRDETFIVSAFRDAVSLFTSVQSIGARTAKVEHNSLQL
ncbi:kinase-like domain-containing protein [Cubamyces lactineus]|nr:kinase-like domain-containing protein [Cubamyces lactineus]